MGKKSVNNMTWVKQKLGNITEIVSGGTPSSSNPDFWIGGDVNWATLPDLSKKYLFNTQRKITKLGLKNSSAKLLPINTIIFSSRATIGEISITKTETTTNQGSKNLICNPEKAVFEFIYYCLKYNVKRIQELASGATYKEINKNDLSNVEIDIPDLSDQKRIAGVLAVYDDLIDNNEKRIRILEEMAQRLYNEWFVKFKFPGYEKVKMIDSGAEYGMIPEGWTVNKLGEIGKAITGKTPPTKNLENFGGEILFIKTPDIHGNIFVLKTEQTLSNIGSKLQSTKTLPEKTVFVSCIGTLGITGITSKPSQTNQQINALILNNADDYIFFYLFIKGLKQKLIGLGSNGATMGNVNKDKFENIHILYPKRKTRESFFIRTSDMFDEIIRLEKQKDNLTKTRDLLIPQLVTGKRVVK